MSNAPAKSAAVTAEPTPLPRARPGVPNSAGPRAETRVAARHDLGGRPVRIGLLGTSGAGKTTYQTALAYTLVRQHDSEHDPDEPLYGQPVGQETHQFLSVRVQELVKGRFPLPTNDATQLLYKLDTGKEGALACIMDYRGGDLSEIYANDSADPKTLPPDLQALAQYFLDCDGYIFLVNARVLLLDEQDEQFQRFFNEFLLYKQVLRYLTERKSRGAGAIQEPFALVATQTDAIDLDNEAVRQRLDRALNHLRDEFSRHIRYQATFLTSAIGRNFLDPATGGKVAHARLEPQNVVAPLRFVLRTRRQHRKRRRRSTTFALLFMLIGGLALGLFLGWFEARQRLAAVEALAENVQEAPRSQLLENLDKLAEKQAALGMLQLLVPRDGERAVQRTRTAILQELDERDWYAFAEAAAERPVNLDRLEELAQAYLEDDKYLGRYGNQRYRDQVRRRLASVRSMVAEREWERAQARDDRDGYVAYLELMRRLDEPGHSERAERRLAQLRLQPFREGWTRIMRRVSLHTQDYEENVVMIHGFLESLKDLDDNLRHQLELTPNPYDEFQRQLRAWDQNAWHGLESLFNERMEIEGGDPRRDLLPVIERYEEYLTNLSRYKTPQHRDEAQARINFLREVSERRTYSLRLLRGEGRLANKPTPSLYVVVYVNDQVVLETEHRGQLNNSSPEWNADFTLRWRAYDEIRVEVWDENRTLMIFSSDVLIHTWSDATPLALKRTFAEPLDYIKTEGSANEFVMLVFEIR